MAGMGPVQKDPGKRARRNKTLPMTMLPAAGRKGAAPKWPLLPDVAATARLKFLSEQAAGLRDEWAAAEDGRSARALAKRLEACEVRLAEQQQLVEQQTRLEHSLWVDLWKTPQAVQWSRLRWTREVAQYVRWKVKAELGALDASRESRMLADRLGLTPLAMLRLRWAVSVDEVAEQRATRTAAKKPAVAKPPAGARSRRGPLRSVPKAAGG